MFLDHQPIRPLPSSEYRRIYKGGHAVLVSAGPPGQGVKVLLGLPAANIFVELIRQGGRLIEYEDHDHRDNGDGKSIAPKARPDDQTEEQCRDRAEDRTSRLHTVDDEEGDGGYA